MKPECGMKLLPFTAAASCADTARGATCLRRLLPLLVTALTSLMVGCEVAGQADRFGRTYYIDGAGNWGFGVAEVHDGLRKAGYKGSIINYRWSPTLNPALDQTVGRPAARLRGILLGREITGYLAAHPEGKVDLICLSAGTGVGIWACETVEPPAKVHSLVMLGSSLACDYDMRKALSNISGGVYVYHSCGDEVLGGPVRVLGTIDGQLGVDSAGLVGLRPVGLQSDKIVNIAWQPEFERYGWTGAHTDATSEPFVRAVLARHIVPAPPTELAHAEAPAPASRPADVLAFVPPTLPLAIAREQKRVGNWLLSRMGDGCWLSSADESSTMLAYGPD